MKSIRNLALAALFFSALCGCGPTKIQMNHTLVPHAPDNSKASANCQDADAQIHSSLRDKKYNFTNNVVVLANNTCADMVVFAYGQDVRQALTDVMDGSSKSYTFFRSGGLINVWPDQPADTFKDASGKILDSSPTDADCTAAFKGLNGKWDKTSTVLVTDRNHTVGPRRCYIEILFQAGEDGYDEFLNWSNPTAATHHEPFHYYVVTGAVTHVVYIHAISAIPQG